MKIPGNDRVIDELLSENDKIVFNLISFIREQNGARIYTDGRSYLTAQTNALCPMWIYVNERADERTERELISVISEALEENCRLSVNACEGFAEKTLLSFSKQHGLKISKRNPLNAYFIRQVREITPVGRLIAAEEKYEKEIAVLIRQATIDDDDGDMTDEEAMQFSKAHSCSGNLFLWEHDKIVSMARIVHYNDGLTRLTSIVTERAARGHGYAKMLVGELSKRLLAQGKTPVLYARSENPSSNRCYQNLGFEKAGEICEFRMEK